MKKEQIKARKATGDENLRNQRIEKALGALRGLKEPSIEVLAFEPKLLECLPQEEGRLPRGVLDRPQAQRHVSRETGSPWRKLGLEREQSIQKLEFDQAFALIAHCGGAPMAGRYLQVFELCPDGDYGSRLYPSATRWKKDPQYQSFEGKMEDGKTSRYEIRADESFLLLFPRKGDDPLCRFVPNWVKGIKARGDGERPILEVPERYLVLATAKKRLIDTSELHVDLKEQPSPFYAKGEKGAAPRGTLDGIKPASAEQMHRVIGILGEMGEGAWDWGVIELPYKPV